MHLVSSHYRSNVHCTGNQAGNSLSTDAWCECGRKSCWLYREVGLRSAWFKLSLCLVCGHSYCEHISNILHNLITSTAAAAVENIIQEDSMLENAPFDIFFSSYAIEKKKTTQMRFHSKTSTLVFKPSTNATDEKA